MYEMFHLQPGDHICLILPNGERIELHQEAAAFRIYNRDGVQVFMRITEEPEPAPVLFETEEPKLF